MKANYDKFSDVLCLRLSDSLVTRDVSYGWHIGVGYSADGKLAEITILDVSSLMTAGVDDDEQRIVLHAEVGADEANQPAPPDGYATWLDYAVETMDTRSLEIERNFLDTPTSRESMCDAVRAELVALRRKARVQ